MRKEETALRKWIERVHEYYDEDGNDIGRVTFFVDSPDELPSPGEEVGGMIPSQGSVAIAINTSQAFIRNGENVWEEWGGEE